MLAVKRVSVFGGTVIVLDQAEDERKDGKPWQVVLYPTVRRELMMALVLVHAIIMIR